MPQIVLKIKGDFSVCKKILYKNITVQNLQNWQKCANAVLYFRNVLGTKCLAEILSERESISHWMETTLDEATDPWGVKVERVEM